MESRIKQLREKRGLIQEILAVELGITQQMLSKYERDVTLIKVDILKKIAAYFNELYPGEVFRFFQLFEYHHHKLLYLTFTPLSSACLLIFSSHSFFLLFV